MKIWIDVLTPKQLLFCELIIEKLGKKHNILCTSRAYEEVTNLAKIRNFDLVLVGKYGGGDKKNKLEAGIDRQSKLFRKITTFSPDLVISHCSPEAARISFGLGIRHIAFCDSPHSDAVLRLTIPLIQKLLIPNIIPKNDFSKYGIDKKNIISYKAIDAVVTNKRKINQKTPLPFQKNKRKNILIRVEEEQAAYTSKSNTIIPIIQQIVNDYSTENIVILGRYLPQIKNLRKRFAKQAKIIKMSFDGKYLLNHTDVFIGSGGTMTAESALMGVPTISYSAVPNIVENYLAKKYLVKKETNPNKISNYIKKIFKSPSNIHQKRAREITARMEDPIHKLIKVMSE